MELKNNFIIKCFYDKMWLDNLWIDRYSKWESKEIAINELPKSLEFDFIIPWIMEKYGDISYKDFPGDFSDKIRWCNIYRIRMDSGYDYDKELTDTQQIEQELELTMKKEWMKKYTKKHKSSNKSPHKLEEIRKKRKSEWFVEGWEIDLEDKFSNKMEMKSKEINKTIEENTYKDIEKFGEYPWIYKLLKSESNKKWWFWFIDLIIIEDNRIDKKRISIPLPKKLSEYIITKSIKSKIKNVLGLSNYKIFEELVNDYTKEILELLKITNPSERKAKLSNLQKTKPDVIKVWNSITKNQDIFSYFSRPNSWGYKYDNLLENLKEYNTFYDIKY